MFILTARFLIFRSIVTSMFSQGYLHQVLILPRNVQRKICKFKFSAIATEILIGKLHMSLCVNEETKYHQNLKWTISEQSSDNMPCLNVNEIASTDVVVLSIQLEEPTSK